MTWIHICDKVPPAYEFVRWTSEPGMPQHQWTARYADMDKRQNANNLHWRKLRDGER